MVGPTNGKNDYPLPAANFEIIESSETQTEVVQNQHCHYNRSPTSISLFFSNILIELW